MNETRKYVSIDRQPTREPSRSAYIAAAMVLVARILSTRPTGRADRSTPSRVRPGHASLPVTREARHGPRLRSILEPGPRADLVARIRHLLHDALEIAARLVRLPQPGPSLRQTRQQLAARVLRQPVEIGCLDHERPLEGGDRRLLHRAAEGAIAHVRRRGAQRHRAYEHHAQRVGGKPPGAIHFHAASSRPLPRRFEVLPYRCL